MWKKEKILNEANLNGNLIREYDKSQLGDEPDALFAVDILAAAENNNPVYGVEGAWGYGYEKKDSNSFGDANFERIYEWDDKNQLIKTKDGLYTTYYVYNNEGDRVAKYTELSETLYFNKFWSWHIDPANAFAGGQLSKHIFLGDTRIVTKLSQETNNYIDAEKQRLYFYHSDYLGSASLITDYKGNEYERLEYTPYGELWVDLSEYTGSTYLPFKFSAKEMDSETGLYYYGARYLDPKYSMWISADPALGEYFPVAPNSNESKQHNSNLPGLGGIYNHINLNLYHYANNNPIRYTDPDGRTAFDARWWSRNWDNLISLGINFSEFLTGVGIAGTTGITGAGAFYGTAMAVHGGLNTAVSVCKIAYTTVMADMYGDDYADRLDARLPDTALGFVGYMMGSLADALVGYSGSNSAEKVGALFDIFDTACGIAISMNLGNLNKAVDSFAKDVGHLIPKKDLIKLQKYLESAGKYTAVDFIKGVIEKYDTLSGVVGNAKQVVE